MINTGAENKLGSPSSMNKNISPPILELENTVGGIIRKAVDTAIKEANNDKVDAV